jgi:hypothetical protein
VARVAPRLFLAARRSDFLTSAERDDSRVIKEDSIMHRNVFQRGAWLLAASLFAASTASTQSDPTPIPPAFALTPQANYGTSVAMTDHVVVVGAPGQSFGGVAKGGVTVSRWSGVSWVSSSLPIPSSVKPGARFGQAVAIDRQAQLIAVGAPANSQGGIGLSGSVYVYIWNPFLPTPAWELDLEAHGIFEAGFFGQSVAITPDYLAVGEPGALFFAGTVNVYQRISAFNWQNVAFYFGVNFFDAFGTAVELSEFGARTDLFVGAPFNDDAAFDAGRVYNYHDSFGWQYIQSQGGVQAEEHFGVSIDARGTHVVVGSPEYDSGASDVGSVSYFYLEGILIPGARLVGKQAGEGLGFSSAYLESSSFVSNIKVFGGAPGAWVNGDGAGLARGGQALLSGSTSPVLTSWSAPGIKAGEQHGFCIATVEGVQSSLQRVAVGVPFDSASGPDTGSLTLYHLLPPGSATDLGFGLAGTGGVAPVLTANGAFEPGTELTVDLTKARPSAPFLLAAGFTQIWLPIFGGTLVPSPDAVLPLPTDSGGSAHLQVLLPPGLGKYTLYLQAWGPDPGGPQGYAASNAVSFGGG